MTLQEDTVSTLEAMLERPRMYATSAESLENVFHTVLLLVAPYEWPNVNVRDFWHGFVSTYTGTNLPLYTKITNIDEMTRVLRDLLASVRVLHVMQQNKYLQ